MQTNLETLDRLERRLTMAVPVDEIEREVEQRLKTLSRTVRMHGFRPGKVPFKLVAQQFGPRVRSEVIGAEVQRAFDAAVQQNQLRVAGNPRIEAGEAGDGSQLAFKATFEVYPELALGDLGGVRIERLTLAVSEEDVDKTIAILRKQRVNWSEAGRASQAGDRLTVDFTGRIEAEEFPGGKGTGVPLVLGEGRMLPDFEAGLSGAAAGESRSFEVRFPDDHPAKETAGKTANFEVTVHKVEAPQLPEVDAAFARSLGVADGDTVKMRTEIRANVEREVRRRIDADLKHKVMQVLLESTAVDLPRALVEQETARLVQAARADLESRGVKLEQIPLNPEVFETQAKRRVSLGLIVGELVKSRRLIAKPEQTRALVEDYAQTYEQPTEMVRWLYSEPKRIAEFEGLAIESNVVNWVLANVKLEDKPIGFDDLMNRAAA